MQVTYAVPEHLKSSFKKLDSTFNQELITKALEKYLLEENVKQDIMLDLILHMSEKIDKMEATPVTIKQEAPKPKSTYTPPPQVEYEDVSPGITETTGTDDDGGEFDFNEDSFLALISK